MTPNEEPYPEGYLEALADCRILAVELLRKMLQTSLEEEAL
jgi:hypothetical protein